MTRVAAMVARVVILFATGNNANQYGAIPRANLLSAELLENFGE
jgi:hypothetical protein